MPIAPVRLCARPSCGRVQPCPEHAQEARQLVDQRRGSSAARGYGGDWQRLRRMVLRREPLCWYCRQRGKLVAATTVDHKTPKSRGGTDARGNLCGACEHCNFSKRDRTAEEFLAAAGN